MVDGSRPRHKSGARAALVDLAAQPAETMLGCLGAHPEGLSAASARQRLAHYGPNVVVRRRHLPVAALRVALTNPMALLLWAGGLVALVGQSVISAGALWMVNVINLLFALWQELQAAGRLRRSALPPETVVRRNGRFQTIRTRNVVPGDVLALREGDTVVADARVLSADGLYVDQAPLTGLRDPMRKGPSDAVDDGEDPYTFPNLVLAGTHVERGSGQAVAIATGERTMLGQLALSVLALKTQPGALQASLTHVARLVSLLSVGAGLITFLLLDLSREVAVHDSALLALSIIVAFVPEGLLPTIAGALILAGRRLTRYGVRIRRFAGLAALGAMDLLCMDSASLLLASAPDVTDLWVEGDYLTVTGRGYRVAGAFRRERTLVAPERHRTLQGLLTAACLASRARLMPPTSASEEWQPLGERTEVAMLVAARKAGLDPEVLAETTPELGAVPFDSARGWAASVRGDGVAATAYIKGEPSGILAASTTYALGGVPMPFDERIATATRAAVQAFGDRGLRVVALAERPAVDPDLVLTPGLLLQHLTFLGLIALVELPRPEVTALIDGCRAAGVPALLVTGEQPLVALSRARTAHLVQPAGAQIVHGEDVATMDTQAIQSLLRQPGQVVFAHVGPRAKGRLVELIQLTGRVVGMLGDGTNDAPALQQADAAMLLEGSRSDIGLDVADVILPPERPDRLILALHEGRAIFANLRKLLGYLFAHNMAEATCVILAALFRVPPPLLVLQVLAIDLGSEILPAVALASEPPELSMLKQPPRYRRILDRGLLLRSLGWIGLIESLVAFLFYLSVPWSRGWMPGRTFPADPLLYREATTLAYLAIVAAQLGNVFASRSETASIFEIGWLSNLNLIWAMLAELVLLGVLLLVPPVRDFFGFALPPLDVLPWLVVPPVLVLAAEEGRKWLLRRSAARTPPSNSAPEPVTAA